MPKAVLEGLKRYPVKISVICAMLDSGGSAGRLRRDYKIVSPGDIRRALIALADTSPVMSDLFNYRFEVGELKGHNFANLLITALELSSNSYEKTRDEVKRMLKIRHEVLPATLDHSNLCAVLENGKVVRGETNIDIPKHDPSLRIGRVFLQPKARAYEKAVNAALGADAIIIGPGDLYSSLAQILLVDGMSEAIVKSKAKKIYLSNIMSKRGETDGYDVSMFTREIEKYLGGEVDRVLYNNRQPTPARVARHKAADKTAVEVVRLNKAGRALDGGKFIGLDLLTKSGPVVHDPEKVAAAIIGLINSKNRKSTKRSVKPKAQK